MKKLKNLDEEIVYDLMCEDGYARVLIDRKTEMLFRKSASNNLFVTLKKGKKKKCDFVTVIKLSSEKRFLGFSFGMR